MSSATSKYQVRYTSTPLCNLCNLCTLCKVCTVPTVPPAQPNLFEERVSLLLKGVHPCLKHNRLKSTHLSIDEDHHHHFDNWAAVMVEFNLCECYRILTLLVYRYVGQYEDAGHLHLWRCILHIDGHATRGLHSNGCYVGSSNTSLRYCLHLFS